MEKHFASRIATSCPNTVDIQMQIIEWWCGDEDNDNEESDEMSVDCNSIAHDSTGVDSVYVMRCFGRTDDNKSITCKITGFKPFYYVKVPDNFDRIKLFHFLNYVSSSYSLKKFKNPLYKTNGKHQSCIVKKKDLFGFKNEKIFKYVKLVFTSYSALLRSRYIFKKAVNIDNVTTKPTKYKLYESNFEPFMRYCHIKDIYTAGWILLPAKKYTVVNSSLTNTNTDIEVEIDRKEVVSLREKKEMGKFLQASWDIEVYSDDYSFPDPLKKVTTKNGEIKYPNEIFQIATTYKYYGDSEIKVKHLLTLKKCAHIDDPSVVVEECANEKQLIKRWCETVSKMDPDIMYTYNGDSFDCVYLQKRAIILGLESYVLSHLSRLSDIPAIIKKEYFSSSAYGDSEYNRMYIPGRLNYDLLIHYKRGMKKYASYKLDHIASEILNEGKHDVTAKDIFKYYETGDPKLIKTIGEYCVQDTELLQKLVDKQLILTNIIQLANVTYVPIGFLTTRGQTIKVYSQVLRKARQMDFLVPHTNFNEDTFPVQIKTKDAHSFDNDDINNYLDIDMGTDPTTKRKFTLSCKISEIVDENNLIALCDTELTKEYFNRTCKYKHKEFLAQRVWSCDDVINDSFTGATVLEAIPGMYTDNIAVLDFASLYPTVEISRNLCFSTLVMDEKYLDIEGVKYETINWDDTVEYKLKQMCEAIGKSGKSKGQVCGKQAFFEDNGKYYCRIHDVQKKSRTSDEKFQKKDVKYSFTIVQPQILENGDVKNKGVVPALLEELYNERKKVKKLMAKASEEKDKVLEDILNSTQLAIKISLNSVYGFLSRNTGNLICKPLGQLTTAIGRMLIEQSKAYAEGEFSKLVKEKKLLCKRLSAKSLDNITNEEKELVLKSFRCYS